MRSIFGQPKQRHLWVSFEPGLDHFGRMGWRLVKRQIQRTGGVRHREPLQKGHKMHRQLAIVIGKEPVTGDRIQGSKEGAAAVDPRSGHAPTRPFHPHRPDQRQEMQLRLVQVEQMAASLHCLPLGSRQGCQFGIGLGSDLRAGVSRGRAQRQPV